MESKKPSQTGLIAALINAAISNVPHARRPRRIRHGSHGHAPSDYRAASIKAKKSDQRKKAAKEARRRNRPHKKRLSARKKN